MLVEGGLVQPQGDAAVAYQVLRAYLGNGG